MISLKKRIVSMTYIFFKLLFEVYIFIRPVQNRPPRYAHPSYAKGYTYYVN